MPAWGQPTPVPHGHPTPGARPQPRLQTHQQVLRPEHPQQVRRQASAPTGAAQHFIEGTGYTPSTAPAGPEPDKPAGVLTAMAMLGLNALVLFVLTVVTIVGSAGSTDPSWGSALFLGGWGLLSTVGALALPTRSRPVFALVVIGQACGAVFLALRMFEVVVHTPDLIVIYALSLLYTLTVGGILLLPAPSRAFFRLG